MPVVDEASTRARVRPDVGAGVSLETFALVHRAMLEREEVWGYLRGRRVRFCPHVLGWRGEDPHVLGLLLQDRREQPPDGGSWGWLLEWQWVPLADLSIPIARKGEWVACPRDQRPAAAEFLTTIFAEAA
ncbi:MAG: hypothetical protein ACE147_12830 [Candidatus Methylomirabilales bacterium]